MKKLLVFALLILPIGPAGAQTVIPRPGTPDRPSIDVESYSIEAQIDPDDNKLTASVEIRFVQLDRRNSVEFDLDRRLRVQRVYLGESDPLPVQFRQFDVDSTILVDLSDLDEFEQPVLRVLYEGRLPVNPRDPEPAPLGIGSDGIFLLEEGKWYPMNGVRQDPARMRMSLDVPAGWEVVTSLMEAPNAPADVPEEDVEIVTEPAEKETAAEITDEKAAQVGVPAVPEPPVEDRPQLVDPDTGNPVAELFGDEPAPVEPSFSYFSDVPGFWGTVMAGDFDRVAPPFVDGAVEVLVSDDSAAAASDLGQMAADMFRFYSELFGPAESPTLRLVEVRAPDWQGQSSPGMLLLPSSAFRSDYDPWELAQQVARQWFPLKFEPGDPVSDAWITEGFGVFASLRYFQDTLSEADSLEYVRRALVKALSYEGNLPLMEAGSLPAGSSDYRSLAGYKGAFIFRMLSEVMGPERFASFVKEFVATFSDQPVTTDALIDLATDVNGESLDYFFSEWLHEPGVPEFERKYSVFRMSSGGYKVEGEITQDLDLFSMPVEIEVITDGEPEYQTVFLSGPSSDVDIFTDRKPQSIVIDPKMKVLRMSQDIRVAVHISRGEDLAEGGEWNAAIDEYQAAIDLNRLSSLAFFRMGEALFELSALPSAADMFRAALNGDLEPTWIEVWSYINLGKIYDLRIQRDRALIEYNKAINTGDDAYGAQAAAEGYIDRPFRTR